MPTKINDTPREAAISGTNCDGRSDVVELVLHDGSRADRNNPILPVKARQQTDTQLHFLAFDSVRYKSRIYEPGQVLEPVLQPRTSATGSPLGGENFVSPDIQMIPP